MNTSATTTAISAPTIGTRVLTQLVAALILGSVILYGAGFANMEAAHSAAHDTRHSQGFPCH